MANTLPDIIGFDTDIQLTSRPSRTWIIDRNTMQVGFMDEGLEAVRQSVEIALNVERFQWQIYNTNFGNELEELVGDDADYIQSELPRMVNDALSVDDRVIDTADYVFSVNGDSMTVSFTVNTVYGQLTEELLI
jgi:hypothetical protein